jgi:hypothetical protein
VGIPVFAFGTSTERCRGAGSVTQVKPQAANSNEMPDLEAYAAELAAKKAAEEGDAEQEKEDADAEEEEEDAEQEDAEEEEEEEATKE